MGAREGGRSGDPFAGLALSHTVVAALRRAVAGRAEGQPLQTGSVLAALAREDFAGDWQRLWLEIGEPEAIGLATAKDTDAVEPDIHWEGAPFSAELASAARVLWLLAEKYELVPVPAGAMTLALLINPAAGATKTLLAGGKRTHAELLAQVQDDILDVELEGLEQFAERTAAGDLTATERHNVGRGARPGPTRFLLSSCAALGGLWAAWLVLRLASGWQIAAGFLLLGLGMALSTGTRRVTTPTAQLSWSVRHIGRSLSSVLASVVAVLGVVLAAVSVIVSSGLPALAIAGLSVSAVTVVLGVLVAGVGAEGGVRVVRLGVMTTSRRRAFSSVPAAALMVGFAAGVLAWIVRLGLLSPGVRGLREGPPDEGIWGTLRSAVGWLWNDLLWAPLGGSFLDATWPFLVAGVGALGGALVGVSVAVARYQGPWLKRAPRLWSWAGTLGGRLPRSWRVVADLITRSAHQGEEVEGYSAFLSYRRRVDTDLAIALQRGLHRIGKAWFERRALRVFRDDSDLAANPDLWAAIEPALHEAEFLILLACPDSATSKNVGMEVAFWLTHKSADTILIVCTSGKLKWDQDRHDFVWHAPDNTDLGHNGGSEPVKALPPVLQGAFANEPLYVDLAWARSARRNHLTRRSRLTLRHRDFHAAVLKLAARLHHTTMDALGGEDTRQQRLVQRLTRAIAASLAVLAILAGAAAFIANDQRHAALNQLQIATSRQLASTSRVQTASDPHLGALLALAADQIRETPESQGALLNALEQLPAVSHVVSVGKSSVNVIANSPDGKTVASGSEDGVVRLWIVDNLQGSVDLTSKVRNVKSLAFSPDGKYLAAGGEGESPYGPGELVVWDLTSHSEVVSMPAHWYGVQTVAFSPDSRLLAFGGGHKTAPRDAENPLGLDVVVWDVTTNAQVASLSGAENSVTGLVFSKDGKTLFSGGYSGVLIWEVSTSKLLARPFEAASAIALSPDGSILAVGNVGKIVLWNVANSSEIGTLLDDGVSFFYPTSVAFSPDGVTLVAAGKAGFKGIDSARLTLWNLNSRSQVSSLTGHTGPVTSVSFGRDSQSLVSGGEDGKLFFWSLAGYDGIKRPLATSSEAISDVQFSPDGRLVLGFDRTAAGEGSSVSVWSSASGAPEPRADMADKQVIAAAQTATGAVIAHVTDGGVAVIDTADGRRVGFVPIAPEALARGLSLIRFEFSKDGSELSIISPSNGIDIWRRSAPEGTANIIGPYGHGFMRAVFDDSGFRLASYGSGMLANNVFVWDARTGAEIIKLDSKGDHIADLAFSPDGSTIAGIGLNGKVYLWDVDSPDPLVVLTGHTDSGGSASFSHDGKVLATASSKEVVLWDVARRVAIGSLPASSNSAGELSFSPDDQTLAVGGTRPALWTVDPHAWRVQLCAVVGRNLTREEWASYVPDMEYQAVCPNYE